MNLGVSVAGHTADWRFRDSPRLEAWLAGRPWLARPEARVVRISNPQSSDACTSALTRVVHSHDEGRGTAVREVRVDETAAGLADALTQACGVSAEGGNRFEMFRRLVYALVDHPTIFLIPPTQTIGPGAVDEAADWLDGVFLTSSAVRILVLLLDTPARGLSGDVFDLSVGLPVGQVLAGADDPGMQWRAYLHHRLAWEVGGAPERAAARGEDVLGLGIGDDEGFERYLNRTAEAEASALPTELARTARQYLEQQAKQSRSRAYLAGEAVQLERAQLLWRPPGGPRLLPVPWLARALLCQGSVSAAVFHLRSCLVCAPLAHELLARCFDLETHERSALYAARGHRPPPEPAVKRWGDYHPSISADLYPPACPGQPDGPWPLATFGEFLKVMADGEPRRDAWYRLLHLRNHLAHGHYVSWAALRLLREVEEQLRE